MHHFYIALSQILAVRTFMHLNIQYVSTYLGIVRKISALCVQLMRKSRSDLYDLIKNFFHKYYSLPLAPSINSTELFEL